MKRSSSTLAHRLDGHFLACTAAVGAAASLAPSQEANATIIYVNLTSTPISIPVTTAGVYLNVVTGVSNVSPASVPGWDLNPFSTTTLSWFNPTTPVGGVYVTGLGSSATLVDNLTIGTLISAASVFGSGASETTGTTALILNSSNNFIGFRFTNETTGVVDFGWVQVQLGATLTSPRSIVAYGYENTGLGITAGAIPEPGTYATLGLMALGAFGVRLWKRAAGAS